MKLCCMATRTNPSTQSIPCRTRWQLTLQLSPLHQCSHPERSSSTFPCRTHSVASQKSSMILPPASLLSTRSSILVDGHAPFALALKQHGLNALRGLFAGSTGFLTMDSAGPPTSRNANGTPSPSAQLSSSIGVLGLIASALSRRRASFALSLANGSKDRQLSSAMKHRLGTSHTSSPSCGSLGETSGSLPGKRLW